MFGSTVLEIGIGMTMLFLFTSLLVTAVTEIIEARLQTRAGDLERGIRELFNDHDGTKLTEAFYAHPIIYSLFRGEYDPRRLVTKGSGEKVMSRAGRQLLPAYIPAGHFATALIDLFGRVQSGDAAVSVRSLRAAAAAHPNMEIRGAILAATNGVGEDLDKARANLAGWFDGTMDRVSGWY